MFRRERRPQPDQIDMHIGANVTMRGDIRCDASVRIDGVLESGNIETLGNVIIGPDARVLADIQADTVSVAGAYNGTMRARRLELLAGGRVWGTIRVESFFLDEGGYMSGELDMITDATADRGTDGHVETPEVVEKAPAPDGTEK